MNGVSAGPVTAVKALATGLKSPVAARLDQGTEPDFASTQVASPGDAANPAPPPLIDGDELPAVPSPQSLVSLWRPIVTLLLLDVLPKYKRSWAPVIVEPAGMLPAISK